MCPNNQGPYFKLLWVTLLNQRMLGENFPPHVCTILQVSPTTEQNAQVLWGFLSL